MNKNNSGFSLIELLTTVGILGVLSAIAIPAYQKYKEEPIKVAMKLEATELSRYLKYAYSVDGGYHQKIYTMGYVPNEKMIANAGFSTGETVPVRTKCNRFPANTGDFSPYLTLTGANMFNSSHVESSTRGKKICSPGNKCSVTEYAYKKLNGGPATAVFNSGDSACTGFNGKGYEPSCDEFYLFSRASLKKNNTDDKPFAQVALNHQGVLCYSEPGTANNTTSTTVKKM